MAEVNAKDLTTKTTPASTDSMLLFGTTTNEGAKITVDNLANNILERIATKTFPNQVGGSSAATILAQLATLNTNLATVENITLTSRSENFVIDFQASKKIGHSLFICCTGHATAALSQETIIGWTPSLHITGAIVGIPTGNSRWSVDGSVAYGYISTSSLTVNLASGKYLHVYLVLPC